jgi:hypothetical protein
VRSDETVLSEDNRHGPVCAPSSHRTLANLGLKMRDANVIKGGKVGAWRTYNFCGVDGEFRDETSWQCIEVFGDDGVLGDEITLTNTVNPGRWSSIYGRPYIVAKAATLRLQEENRYYSSTVRKLRKRFPQEKPSSSFEQDGVKVEVEVTAFEAQLEGFEMSGTYPDMEVTQAALEQAQKRLSKIRALLKRLNFPVRVSEAAFVKHGLGGADPIDWCNGDIKTNVSRPPWCDASITWETGWKQSNRHKNKWARRRMPMGLFLRFRAWRQKTQLTEEEAAQILTRQAA